MKLKTKQLFRAGLAARLSSSLTPPSQGENRSLRHRLRRLPSSKLWMTFNMSQVKRQATRALAVAPNGIVFAAGYASEPDGLRHALVRASADGGKTWSAPLDDFTGGPGNDAYYNAVACDAAGDIYAAGVYYDDAGLGPNHWVVRRSTDGGATWSTVDDYVSDPNSSSTQANAIAADAAGNVYVAGYDDIYGWIVRKGIGGGNFATVDTLPSYNLRGATSILFIQRQGFSSQVRPRSLLMERR